MGCGGGEGTSCMWQVGTRVKEGMCHVVLRGKWLVFGHVRYHFWKPPEKNKGQKLMTLIRGDKCYAVMHLGAIGPRVLCLHNSHNSAISLMRKDHCHLVNPAGPQQGHLDCEHQFLSTWSLPWTVVGAADKHVYMTNYLNPRLNLVPFLGSDLYIDLWYEEIWWKNLKCLRNCRSGTAVWRKINDDES